MKEKNVSEKPVILWLVPFPMGEDFYDEAIEAWGEGRHFVFAPPGGLLGGDILSVSSWVKDIEKKCPENPDYVVGSSYGALAAAELFSKGIGKKAFLDSPLYRSFSLAEKLFMEKVAVKKFEEMRMDPSWEEKARAMYGAKGDKLRAFLVEASDQKIRSALSILKKLNLPKVQRKGIVLFLGERDFFKENREELKKVLAPEKILLLKNMHHGEFSARLPRKFVEKIQECL